MADRLLDLSPFRFLWQFELYLTAHYADCSEEYLSQLNLHELSKSIFYRYLYSPSNYSYAKPCHLKPVSIQPARAKIGNKVNIYTLYMIYNIYNLPWVKPLYILSWYRYYIVFLNTSYRKIPREQWAEKRTCTDKVREQSDPSRQDRPHAIFYFRTALLINSIFLITNLIT